jgi:protein TonB
MKSGIAAICLSMAFATAGSAESARKLTHSEAMSGVVGKVAPEYPVIARQLKIAGVVEVEALVTETGQVEEVTIVSGNPVLTKPAVDAVKKWRFTPQTQDGKAVRALAPVSISFKP